MNSIIEFEDVSKDFIVKRKLVHALRKVSFTINPGEVFGFVGPNGAGKSTTIKILLSIIGDYRGSVRIYGRDARGARSRRVLAYVPEANALYEQFTPLEVLETALRMYGVKGGDNKARCTRWLERFSIAQYSNRKIRNLSKGNAQRVALAHAMVVEPRLLVLDEPLSGLDPVGRKDVIDVLQEYKAQGGAIFFTSHVLYDVERIADRFGFINEGRLLTTKSPKDLMSEYADRFVVRYQSEVVREGMQLRDGEYEYSMDQSSLPDWLNKLNQNQGQLLEVKPMMTLEKVFFRLLEDHSSIE